MTSTPAQIEAREPGWYWILDRVSGEWRPDEWLGWEWEQQNQHGARGGKPKKIGPRIPDPVTLQQHERLEATLRSAPVLSMYHGQQGFEVERFIVDYQTWRKQCLAALDTAETTTGEAR